MTHDVKTEELNIDALTGGLGEDDGQGPVDMNTDPNDPSGSGGSAEVVPQPEGGDAITPDN